MDLVLGIADEYVLDHVWAKLLPASRFSSACAAHHMNCLLYTSDAADEQCMV